MTRRAWLVAIAFVAVDACGGSPWRAANVPESPPDEQFRTGVEAGEDVYVWNCYRGERVMVSQFGSACFGTRAPVVERGPCGKPLAGEARFEHYNREGGAGGMPESMRWPGSAPPTPPSSSSSSSPP